MEVRKRPQTSKAIKEQGIVTVPEPTLHYRATAAKSTPWQKEPVTAIQQGARRAREHGSRESTSHIQPLGFWQWLQNILENILEKKDIVFNK